MHQTIFKINKMDCPSEEELIRLSLNDLDNIVNLIFDIENRTLTIIYHDEITKIEQKLFSLNLGSQKISTSDAVQTIHQEDNNQKQILIKVLLINFVFFIIEIATGIISQSMGLIADGLDMLADSFVYAISLLAIGTSIAKKKQIAKIAGYSQIVLACVGFLELLRRVFFTEEIPSFKIMIIISILALIANSFCLYLLHKSKSKNQAHMKASVIFTSNDIIINLGIILAGVLVPIFESNKPDLIIGSIVFFLVMQGAFRILKIAK